MSLEQNSALAILAAMITPAVLISSCGTLLLSTSNRLGRTIDRVRALDLIFEELSKTSAEDVHTQQQIAMLFDQLDLLTSRARLLQQIMTALYRAIGIFVATSLMLGAVSLVERIYAWLPVALGGIGACFLFYASMLMMQEARLALKGIYKEMDYLWQRGRLYAPPGLLQEPRRRPWGI